MDKNFLSIKLEEVMKQSKGDLGRNQYILDRIKENKEIFNSDRLYLERISGTKILDKQHPQISKKDKSVSSIQDLVKCATCNKEIKMNEKSARHRNFWYHETCYKTIPKNKHDQEKSQKNIILKNINSKTIHEEISIIKKPILEHIINWTKKVESNHLFCVLVTLEKLLKTILKMVKNLELK